MNRAHRPTARVVRGDGRGEAGRAGADDNAYRTGIHAFVAVLSRFADRSGTNAPPALRELLASSARRAHARGSPCTRRRAEARLTAAHTGAGTALHPVKAARAGNAVDGVDDLALRSPARSGRRCCRRAGCARDERGAAPPRESVVRVGRPPVRVPTTSCLVCRCGKRSYAASSRREYAPMAGASGETGRLDA